jgi:hypothetical protein
MDSPERRVADAAAVHSARIIRLFFLNGTTAAQKISVEPITAFNFQPRCPG